MNRSGRGVVRRTFSTVVRRSVARARVSRLAGWIKEQEAPSLQRVPTGTFHDALGEALQMFAGHRDRVKPNWRAMFASARPSISGSELAAAVRTAHVSVATMARILTACGVREGPMRILEVGCHRGERAYALAARGHRVVAIDLPDYYVRQSSVAVPGRSGRIVAEDDLRRLRATVREGFDPPEASGSVAFVHGDIASGSFTGRSFDLIASWEVLEHVTDPEGLMRESFRLLTPGGVAFHEYNPFFALDGGHSLVTLDIPFGHARLAAEGVADYVRRFRPEEAEVDLRFYHRSLNRMTIADVGSLARLTGFEIVALVPWPAKPDLEDIDGDTLRQVRVEYPSVQLVDLLSRMVWVVLRRPHDAPNSATR